MSTTACARNGAAHLTMHTTTPFNLACRPPLWAPCAAGGYQLFYEREVPLELRSATTVDNPTEVYSTCHMAPPEPRPSARDMLPQAYCISIQLRSLKLDSEFERMQAHGVGFEAGEAGLLPAVASVGGKAPRAARHAHRLHNMPAGPQQVPSNTVHPAGSPGSRPPYSLDMSLVFIKEHRYVN